MKKWCIIDNCGTDEFLTVFKNIEEALEAAENEWGRLTEHDKKRRESYIVGLVNVDENGNYLEDENGNVDADIYEIVKEYK